MRRVLRIIIAGPLLFFMAVLLTAVYPIWRFTFWLFNDPAVPPPGYWKGIWREWWDEVIVAP